MSTVTLPPIGAKIRVTTTWPSGTTVVTEGIVTGHPSEIATPDDRAYVELGDPRGPIAHVCDFGSNAVTVEVLSLPLPAEPPNHAFVHIVGASGVGATAAQRVGRDGGRVDRWFLIGSERARKWAEICELGTVTPMRQDPFTDAGSEGEAFTDPGDGSHITVDALGGRKLVRLDAHTGNHNATVDLMPDDAIRFAGTVLAAARRVAAK